MKTKTLKTPMGLIKKYFSIKTKKPNGKHIDPAISKEWFEYSKYYGSTTRWQTV